MKHIPAKEPVSVRIEGLKKAFSGHEVIKGIDLDIKPGETFVIMGPSGSGKSVLLKHIIGLMTGDQGSVLIDNKDARDPKTHRDIVTSIVFQDGALFNSMSVYDNLTLYAKEHRLWDKKTLDEKVSKVLDILSLKNTTEKMPSELSGGMKKRVAVARALMMEPQLLLYDEPTSELDPILAATISELIATVSRESGLTSIVVTHDRDLALSISDRIALMLNGKIEFLGTIEEFRTSQNPKVISFLNPQIDINNPRFRQ